MNTQQKISYELNKKHVGEVMDAIVIGSYRNSYLVRTYFNAPDDIDGNVYISSARPLKLGEEVKVKITSASVYDLEGELL